MDAERPHVLIVTDDPDLGGFLTDGIMLGGAWVSIVASAIQTLELFRLRSFDLVLVDSALGGVSGVELVRRLRGRSSRSTEGSPRTDVPIVMITEHGLEQQAWASGVDDVLVPPIDIEWLVPRLLQLVAAWRAHRPGRPTADQAAQRSDGTQRRVTPEGDERQ